MATEQPQQEQDWRKTEFKIDLFFYQITFGIIAIIVSVLVGFVLFPDDMGYKSNLYTTAVGVLVTVAFLDLLNRRRDDRNAIKQLKERLIIQMAIKDNGIALHGLAELQARGWVKDGSLKEANLSETNLQGADLQSANLQGVDLTAANLQGAKLLAANLRGAKLMRANLQMATLLAASLQDADLRAANLQGANLGLANLQRANLQSAKLQGADLTAANLQGATLRSVEFDEATILPDESHWTPDTDMTRFTQLDNAPE